ncbi:MAG: prepilin-type N-terminal cleavage/methylation domain-containing protein [Planctomycetes bacterium]|nr:prepilin-type N-terminal cleavage/methylation domain-containing protein [Planctomycetota bacterium]
MRGFSFIEILIAVAILALVLGATYAVLASSMRSYTNQSNLAAVQERARQVMDEMIKELRMADKDTLIIGQLNGSGRIDCAVATGYAGGKVVLSTPIQYQCEPSPVDANNNGQQDESRLVRIQEGRTLVLCQSVKTGGLTITRTGNNLTVKLEVIATDEANRELSTVVESSVTLRN